MYNKHDIYAPFLEMVDDFETFLDKLEKRREQLEEVRDELLIYSNPEFMESLRRADEDSKAGRVTHCKDMKEVEKLFKSL